MIKEVILIQELMDVDFHNSLVKTIRELQQAGRTVEVQYGGENSKGYFSAVILGREKE